MFGRREWEDRQRKTPPPCERRGFEFAYPRCSEGYNQRLSCGILQLITSHLVAVFWQPSGMASSYISRMAITSDLAGVVCQPSRMAITNDLPSVFCLVSRMASSSISCFIEGMGSCAAFTPIPTPTLPLKGREFADTELKLVPLLPESSNFTSPPA